MSCSRTTSPQCPRWSGKQLIHAELERTQEQFRQLYITRPYNENKRLPNSLVVETFNLEENGREVYFIPLEASFFREQHIKNPLKAALGNYFMPPQSFIYGSFCYTYIVKLFLGFCSNLFCFVAVYAINICSY